MFDHRGAKGGDPGWSGGVDVISSSSNTVKKKSQKKTIKLETT